MTQSGDFISAVQASKTYTTRSGLVHAVQGANFSAKEGQFISLLGPSGCGKSTLLMMLAGLESASSGKLVLAGEPVLGPRRDTGVIFQDATLLPWKSVLDNVLFPVDILKLARSEYLDRARNLGDELEEDQIGIKSFARNP